MADRKQVPGAGVPPPAVPKGAPLYEALGPVFVNARLHEKGEQFRSAEKPGRLWRLIEDAKPVAAPAKRGKAEASADGAGREADQSPI